MSKLNKQIEEYKEQLSGQENETQKLLAELDAQKQLNTKSPTQQVKSIVEKLRQQLAEKDEQHKLLNQVLADLKSDMLDLAKTNLTSLSQSEQTHEKKWHEMAEKTSAQYQDKICQLGEEILEHKKELKEKTRSNDELKLECDYLKSQLKSKDQRVKKLLNENQKLVDDQRQGAERRFKSSLPGDVELDLRKQIKNLEEKLRKERLNRAERPYADSRSKVSLVRNLVVVFFF